MRCVMCNRPLFTALVFIAGTPTEDAQQRVGVPAVSPESAHSQPDEREGDAPALIQIGPLDV